MVMERDWGSAISVYPCHLAASAPHFLVDQLVASVKVVSA
jgi:hypothetical protein